ncbi:MAG: membrane dipeptidase [Rhodospirillales bacterium]|nr:membrane dipeptidase [Rhodospirillales bacterium]
MGAPPDDPYARARKGVSPEAAALFEDALVWDMTLPWGTPCAEPDVTLPRFQAASVDLISLTVQDGQETGVAEAVRHMARVTRDIAERADRMVLCRTADDILAAKAAGKLALIFNHQETNPLEGRVEMVQAYYDLGVRHILLAYNKRNRAGDGCAEATDAGLSRFGIRAVEEMNRVGMLVDGTHCGYRTSMEAIEVSSAPVIFSHCDAHAVFPHYRNIRDDQIKACAAAGGVIGVNGVGAFLGDAEASTESMFRHIDHMTRLVGAEHVGIGLDYLRDTDRFWTQMKRTPELWPLIDGKPHQATRFVQPEQLVELTDLMLERGYAAADVRGILGGNFLRLARQVWK